MAVNLLDIAKGEALRRAFYPQGGQPGPVSGMPVRMPANQPVAPQQMQPPMPIPQPEMPLPQSSPLEEGAMRGINIARESLRATEQDKERAFGLAMMKFASEMSKPRQFESPSGILGGLGAINQAFYPAAQEYAGEQARAEAMNAFLYQQAMKQRAEDLKNLRQLQKDESLEKYRADKLEETRRHHDMVNNRLAENAMRRSSSSSRSSNKDINLGLNRDVSREDPQNFSEAIDLSQYTPIQNKNMQIVYQKEKKNTSDMLFPLKEIKKELSEFKELSKNDTLDPMNPYWGGLSSKVKDIAGRVGKSLGSKHKNTEHWNKERLVRKNLASALDRFSINLERKMKGGVLSEGMMKRFENRQVLPSIHDSMDELELKTNSLIKELEAINKSSTLSLKYGVQLSPEDVGIIETKNKISQYRDERPELNSEGFSDDEIAVILEEEGLL